MVQTLQWQPDNASVLLSGTRAGGVRLDDGRAEAPVGEWTFEGVEVEAVRWHRNCEQHAFALTSDGKLRYLDVRAPGACLIEQRVHEEEATALTLSEIDGLVATTGGEVCSRTLRTPKIKRLAGGAILAPRLERRARSRRQTPISHRQPSRRSLLSRRAERFVARRQQRGSCSCESSRFISAKSQRAAQSVYWPNFLAV